MVQKNFAHEVGRLAGVDLSLQAGGSNTAAGAMAHAQKASQNLQAIQAMSAELCKKPDAPDASAPSSALKGTLTEGMVVGAATLLSPVAGAVIGAAYITKEVAQFLQHAGTQAATLAMVKNNGGSMNLTHDAATFDKDGEMTGYISACDGIMTDVATGQTVSQPQTQAPMTKLGQSVQEALNGYGDERAAQDVAALTKKQMETHGWASRKVKELTGEDREPNGGTGDNFDLKRYLDALQRESKNTAPGLSYAAPVAPSVPTFG